MAVGMGVDKEKILVVNADDFGLDREINRGIALSCRQGIVRSVSLVAGGEAFDDAIGLLGGLPGTGAGVHLCLVGERPVSPVNMLPTLVDGEGWLPASYRDFLFRLWTGRISLPEVGIELEAQVRKVLDRGVRPTHLDSHQYLYFIPAILRIVMGLSQKYGIGWLRYPLCPERTGGPTLDGGLKLLWIKVFGRAQAREIRMDGRGLPDRSYGVEAGGRLDLDAITGCLRGLGEGVNDLTCHPGYLPSTRRYDGWHYHWEKELAALTDPAVAGLADSLKIKLGNYAI